MSAKMFKVVGDGFSVHAADVAGFTGITVAASGEV